MTAPTTQMVTVLNRTGELVRIGGGRVFVASKSEPGRFYDVTSGQCQCKGYEYRKTCRHIACAPRRPEPPPTSPASCPRCQRPTTPMDARSLDKLGQCHRCVNEMLYGPEEVA